MAGAKKPDLDAGLVDDLQRLFASIVRGYAKLADESPEKLIASAAQVSKVIDLIDKSGVMEIIKARLELQLDREREQLAHAALEDALPEPPDYSDWDIERPAYDPAAVPDAPPPMGDADEVPE